IRFSFKRHGKKLPKLAISAKVLLCLLMVAISEGTPVIREVRLLNKGSSSWVNVNNRGLVSLKEVQDGYETLRFVSGSSQVGTVKIYGVKSNRWLCYNKRWKLVGKLNGTEGPLGELCLFSEEMYENYYFLFRSVKDKKHMMGFRSDGRQVRKMRAPSEQDFFSKIDEGMPDLIAQHNEIISAPSSADRRSEYALPPALLPVYKTATRQRNNRHPHRHRHGNRRRKLPNNNTAAV
ncbi:hypothetical protein GE061_006953, partial [Apolygus lucorum]